MSVRIVELARHDTRSLTRAVRNDIALLKECEVHAWVAAINMAPLTGCRCLLRSRAINMSLLWSEEQEETIRFHLRPPRKRTVVPPCGISMARPGVMESFDRFQLAGLALICLKNETLVLICLKNETKADAERFTFDLRDLISAAGAEVAEKARRERLLRHLESADKAHPLELAKYSLERAGASSSEMDIKP